MKTTVLTRTFFLGVPLAMSLLLIFSTVLIGQDRKNNDGTGKSDQSLVFSHTASFSPGTHLWFQFESPVFNDGGSSGKLTGSARVGLLEMLQLEVSNEGTITRSDGDVQPQMTWGMECRLYQSESKTTSLSALLRSSLGLGQGTLDLRESDSTFQSD